MQPRGSHAGQASSRNGPLPSWVISASHAASLGSVPFPTKPEESRTHLLGSPWRLPEVPAARLWCSSARGDVVVPALTPGAVPGRGQGVQALTLLPLPALSPSGHPPPFCSPTMAPDLEGTNKHTGLRGPYPSCLTTPGATSGPCVPPSSPVPRSKPRTCQLEQGAQTLPGHSAPAASILPRGRWDSSSLRPTPGSLGSAAIVHAPPSPPPGVVSGLPFSQNRKQVAAVHFLSLFPL